MLTAKHYKIAQGEWPYRSKFIGDYIIKNKYKYIFDMGCGIKDLKKYISPSQIYTGYDFRPFDSEVKFCDFNESFPKINLGLKTDRCGVVLGLLEYLDNVEKFLVGCRENFGHTILSYTWFGKTPEHQRPGDEGLKQFNMIETKELETMLFSVFGKFKIKARHVNHVYVID